MTRSCLITGFSPFLGDPVNPTAELLQKGFAVSGVRITTVLLPVSYQNAFIKFKEVYPLGPWDCVILLGQARGRTSVSLERVALNWTDSSYADEDGLSMQEKTIDPLAAPALFTSVSLRRIWQQLKNENFNVEISLSAGAYVCNHLYFQVLKEVPKETPVLFVHVPLCEKNQSQSSDFKMPLLEMHSIISRLIELLTL